MDVFCASRVWAIHAAGSYPASLSAETPVSAKDRLPDALRMTAQACRRPATTSSASGLSNTGTAAASTGAVTASRDVRLLTFHLDRLIPGVSVSGSVSLLPASVEARVLGEQAGVAVSGTTPAP